MKNVVVLIIVLLLSFSCKSYDYKITSLEQKNLKYDELPIEVKKYLSNPPDPIGDSYKMLIMVNANDSTNFSLETITTWYGPWVDYEKLKDKQKNKSYRINQGVPSPYIIFKNKLYIPDRFNILGSKSVFKAIYTEYQLK
jgi:hypothetical protein